MEPNAYVGVIGGVVVALVVKVSNMIVVWLARVLGVTEPELIDDDPDGEA